MNCHTKEKCGLVINDLLNPFSCIKLSKLLKWSGHVGKRGCYYDERKEFTCPLELVHDMIKVKWKSGKLCSTLELII